MSTFIIVHCYNCHPYACWYPTLKEKLEAGGHSVFVPELKGGEKPKAEDWVGELKTLLERATPPVVLIGHSLGTRAALLTLDQSNISIERLVLVGALDNEIDNKNRIGGKAASFFEEKIDLESIKQKAADIRIVHSSDDDRVVISEGEALAREFSVPLISVEGFGHFLDKRGSDLIYKLAIGETVYKST